MQVPPAAAGRVQFPQSPDGIRGIKSFTSLWNVDYARHEHNFRIMLKKSRLEILKRHFKNIPIDGMTPERVDGFMAARKKAGVGNRTINRDLSVLSHLYSWAITRKYLDRNPIVDVERLEEVAWVGRRPEDEFIDQIIAKLDPRVRPPFVFLKETGCRREEACQVRRYQIDFTRAVVTLYKFTKNVKKPREVPLTEAALCAIAAVPQHGETVFYHPDTLEPWTGDCLASYWEEAREKAGHPWLRVHDLRHAFGIRLAERGCPMHFISEVMGHHSVDFTRENYARFSPESASRAVLKVLEGGLGKRL